MDVVMINRGDREGLLVGNVLAVYKVGETVRDRVTNRNVKLPDERAGLVMVFRTFEKMSLAIVLEAERPLGVNDRDRKSTRLNSSHVASSYAVFCLKKKNKALQC